MPLRNTKSRLAKPRWNSDTTNMGNATKSDDGKLLDVKLVHFYHHEGQFCGLCRFQVVGEDQVTDDVELIVIDEGTLIQIHEAFLVWNSTAETEVRRSKRPIRSN